MERLLVSAPLGRREVTPCEGATIALPSTFPILSQVPRMSSERKAMHAGEAVAEALREEGVERVYSVPGSHIHPIYDGLSRVETIRIVTCKQEPNVSLMADAYGRLTGKPGVCLVTAGPGGLNSMAGVAQAYGAASPMVHIGGAVPLKADMEAFHGVDHPAFVHEMFQHITKWSARVERIEDIPEVIR